MSDAVPLEPLLRALAAELKRRHMTQHLEALRTLFALRVHKRRRKPRGSSLELDEADALEWARCLQVPPFESFYPVLWKPSMCPRCSTPSAVGFVVTMWVDGAKRQCHFCQTVWIERELPSGAKSYAPHKDQR